MQIDTDIKHNNIRRIAQTHNFASALKMQTFRENNQTNPDKNIKMRDAHSHAAYQLVYPAATGTLAAKGQESETARQHRKHHQLVTTQQAKLEITGKRCAWLPRFQDIGFEQRNENLRQTTTFISSSTANTPSASLQSKHKHEMKSAKQNTTNEHTLGTFVLQRLARGRLMRVHSQPHRPFAYLQ